MDATVQSFTPTKIAQPAALQAGKEKEDKTPEVTEPKDQVLITGDNKTPEIASKSTFWSKAGKGALLATGIAAGAALAYVAAQGALQGTFWVNAALFKYMVPQNAPNPQIAASYYVQAMNRGLQMAPAAGALAGGILTGLAMRDGSDMKIMQEHPGVTIKGRFNAALHNFQDTMRETGESLRKGLNEVKEAKSFGEAISAGGAAGYKVGETIGHIGGFVEGAYQGSALLSIFAGAPWAFPAISVPYAILGGLGMGLALAQVGSLVGGVAGAVTGGAASGVAYGAKKLYNAIAGKSNSGINAGVS